MTIHRCHPDWCAHPDEPDPLLACTCGAVDYRVCHCGTDDYYGDTDIPSRPGRPCPDCMRPISGSVYEVCRCPDRCGLCLSKTCECEEE